MTVKRKAVPARNPAPPRKVVKGKNAKNKKKR